MVDVGKRTCGDEGCSTRPSYGVAGSKRAESCSQHARAGMVDVVTKKCGHQACPMRPSCGVAGSKKAEYCKKAEFCSHYAKAGIVRVVSYRSSKEGRLNPDNFNNDNLDVAMLCRQHPTAYEAATVYDMENLSTGEATSTRSTTDGSEGSVAGVRGTKRKRGPCLSSGTVDVVDAQRSVSPVARRSGVTPLLRSGQVLSGAGREVSSVPRVGGGIKVEVSAPSPTHGGAVMEECSKHTFPLRGWSSAGGQSGSGSNICGVSAGRLYCSPAVVCGSLVRFVGVESVKTLEGSSVKLELGVASDR
ncbi:unnamed protein product [Sphacelaria rigidula]